ncbi:hypothetical protein [Erwinia pyrifoliae]|uniref:Uncharacterized protein n=1 Tax=Erwinia pyrifoliae TaxID=79967 RepID=A0ABY5X7B8_ERWPY|nr:hypothetical protein [Erwinia pyrifoliae]MCT2387469.1 hypothetical protein [Erwinia pyrifoliae]MCU8585724.1 hypothetical protein [Erwinia pyrifoliae]UWS28981.1 hypothetical protein NYP81_13765 [Erwinia pyrifoliae]UWS33281.1 hypothetical protein NYP84_17120 [Erwinia pyrifoliae]UXK11973.1 hypothetical protein NYP80_17085 [Erwinia pyrifoliae]
MKEHPNKHIQAAIEYAMDRGWRFRPASGHAFGRLMCGIAEHQQHQMSVWTTPRVPEHHAAQIRRKVDSCQSSILTH